MKDYQGILDYSNRNTCVLFGDGAGASIIELSNDVDDEVFFVNNSRPDKVDALTVDKYIKMDGKKSISICSEVLSKQIKAVLEKSKLDNFRHRYDYFAPSKLENH